MRLTRVTDVEPDQGKVESSNTAGSGACQGTDLVLEPQFLGT
jgi:hypothetical protein